MSRDYRRYHNPLAAGFLLLLLTGCETQFQSIALGAVGATVLGAQAPNNEIEQIYYLGSFDPQDQLPPQVYRVRVHGQASAISGTKFASGWVQSKLIDSLGTSVSFEKGSKNPKIQTCPTGIQPRLKPAGAWFSSDRKVSARRPPTTVWLSSWDPARKISSRPSILP